MLPARLKADCSSCQGLCCVALAFDAGADFALNKPAHVPCPFLGNDDRCVIHDRLRQHGFSGCVTYDCYGAGQWVTQRVLKGASWRQAPEHASEVFETFRIVRAAHELMAMLTIALTRSPDGAIRDELEALLQQTETRCSEGATTDLPIADMKRRLLKLMRNTCTP